MDAPDAPGEVLETSAGSFPLNEYRLRQGREEWSVLHTGAVLTGRDEDRLLGVEVDRLPYGASLWPSAIALAHEIVARPDAFPDRTVLELGAGTGLPGIVAASLGARVVQVDRDELVLSLCRRNGRRNRVGEVAYRLADWAHWSDAGRYDWILGADVLYAEAMHLHLRRIFETNLASAGRVLLSDPLRTTALRLLEMLEQGGWSITMNRWDVGEEGPVRPIGVFELSPT